MKNFLIGLGISITGMTAAIVFRVLYGMSHMGEDGPISFFLAIMWIGVALIFLGPLWFWLITPLRNRLTRRSPGRT